MSFSQKQIPTGWTGCASLLPQVNPSVSLSAAGSFYTRELSPQFYCIKEMPAQFPPRPVQASIMCCDLPSRIAHVKCLAFLLRNFHDAVSAAVYGNLRAVGGRHFCQTLYRNFFPLLCSCNFIILTKYASQITSRKENSPASFLSGNAGLFPKM